MPNITIDTTFTGGYTSDTTSYSDAQNFTNGVPSDAYDVAVAASANYNISAYDDTVTKINSFHVRQGHNKNIGALSDGVGSYLELNFSDTTDGLFNYAGTGNCYIGINNSQDINIMNAGSGVASNLTPALYLIGTGNTVTNMQSANGIVGLAWLDGETYETDKIVNDNGTCLIGRGVTKIDGSSAPEVEINGGIIYSYSTIKLTKGDGGSVYMLDGDLEQMNATSTNVHIRNSCNITDPSIGYSGILNTEQCSGTVTINSDCTYIDGGKIQDKYQKISDISVSMNDSDGVSIANNNFRFGVDRTLTIENTSDISITPSTDGVSLTVKVKRFKTNN